MGNQRESDMWNWERENETLVKQLYMEYLKYEIESAKKENLYDCGFFDTDWIDNYHGFLYDNFDKIDTENKALITDEYILRVS